MSLAAIILCIVRRKFTLERFDPMSAVTDTIVAFIGGGRFQMANKLEKWIFGILSLGAFFIISLFAGDMLFYMYRILNQKVNTFQELSTIETPIHSNPTLTMYGDDIQKMLRFV